MDLREEWSPKDIYGEDDYVSRMRELSRRRYYSRDAADKAGILRYTKVEEAILDISDIPARPPKGSWLGFCPSTGTWTKPTTACRT